MERRASERFETRFEVVWEAGSLEGVGVLRNLSRAGAWIDDLSVQPHADERIRIAIQEEGRHPVAVSGVVVRRTSEGFAVELDTSAFSVVGLLLDRFFAESGPVG